MKQAVILVGGKGARLGALAGERPKPFVEVGGKPFIDHLIIHAKCQGVERVLLLAGHAAEWIEENYQCSVADVEVELCVEAEPMGTAGALLAAGGKLDDVFFLLNGDSILNGSWSALFPLLTDGVEVALGTRAVADIGRYGRVVTESTKVTNFAEKSGSGPGDINAGIYLVRRNSILPMLDGPASMEEDILPKLVKTGQVQAATIAGYFIDIGLPETLETARNDLVENLRRPAVFFDRDGTLVEDEGYTHKVEDLVWKPGAIASVRALNGLGYAVFIVTNQAGIARGYYGEAEMQKFHAAMQRELARAGARIDGFYHCPHHPEGKVPELTKVCGCRKPATGMLDRAFNEHLLDQSSSVLIGDNEGDIGCGEAYGIRAFHYTGGSLVDVCKNAGVL